MEFDAATLARLQFAFTIAFHILFPTLTIGLGGFLVFIEAQWLRTGDRIYELLYKFWTKVFALAFGMGVVTGVVLSYEVGTNWSRFADVTGNILGPLLSYEVLSAFFLEAGFVGIMLFGWNRVGPRMHFFATAMVGSAP
jgi:cytochrome d ubiquinol oxidase subunit I